MADLDIDYTPNPQVDIQNTTEGFFRDFQSDGISLGGFKIVRVVYDAASALFDAAATSDTAEILAATSGRQVLSATIKLDTQFTLPGDRTGLTVSIGEDGGDVDDVVTVGAMNLSSDAVGTTYKTRGVVWDTQAETTIFNRVIDATAALSGGSSGNLSAMTVGQITIYLVTLDW